jgi:signal transduction histidine kinase
MYTEMLAKGMVPSERRVRYLETLRIEADRLAHLVENVLAYARLERGRAVDRLETTTPAIIIERVGSRLADRAEQAGMKLNVDLSGVGDAMLQADPTAVEQILFNLVDNACKYASVGEDRSIQLRTVASNSTVNFEVSDHGPGVSAEQRTRLFQPFSKSAQQAAHSAPGVGLGLALSRRLARSMGGELRLSQNGEHGATFVLELPALQ